MRKIFIHKKIYSIEELLDILKNSEKKNTLCCGCFDVFHIGHLEYLNGSKDQYSNLIVAVNSDKSYEKLRGYAPIFNEADRAEVIASLESVDYVTIFNELNCCKLLRFLKIDTFCMGIDKLNKETPELKTCSELNISVRYIGEKKRSSSSIIKKALTL